MTENNDSTVDHGVGHVVPIRMLAVTAIALLILTVVTVAIASYDFGKLNIWVALAIAVVKASLVLLFFMHLLWDRPFNGLVFCVAIAFLALFIAFALTDTHEYAPDIDTGDSPNVVQQLTELES